MLVVFSIFVFTVSRMKEVNRYLVGSIILMDSMWVIGSILLITFGASLFTQIGLLLIGTVAVIIGVFAYLQSFGLIRHLRTL
ncbi:MAG: hypothetical protein MUC29_12030 [Pyrinomonadaceae bacterium]|nr:hypothetical protein [Pyrinomonadaceae bacterium]